VHGDAGDQVEQAGHQHVVEQDHPAGQEADRRGDAAPGVAVDRAGHRERAHHLRVGQGGEHHRHHADHVGQGDHAAGAAVHAAEDAEGCDRHHEDEAVDEQIGEAQRAAEFLAVAEFLDSGGGRCFWGLSHGTPSFRV
jgi:hypothetical protein